MQKLWELDAVFENALRTDSKQAISKLTFKNILSFITRQFYNLQEALHYMSDYFLAQMIIRLSHSAAVSTEVLLKEAAMNGL